MLVSHPPRGVWFVLNWTLAHALIVSSVTWVMVQLVRAVDSSTFGPILFFVLLGLGLVAGFQQFFLDHYGLRAPLWVVASYFAWGTGLMTGAIADDASRELVAKFKILGEYREEAATFLATIPFGAVFGGMQMLACEPLRKRRWIWPLANCLAFPPVAVIGAKVRFAPDLFGFYLTELAAGATYGLITATVLVMAARRTE